MKSEYNEFESKLFKIVEEHGWQFNFVFDPDGEEPDFGYSIGFASTLNAPEFIVFGLPKELMQSMLWGVFRQIEKGAPVHDGAIWEDLLEGFSCVSRKASHPNLYKEYATSANWYWKQLGNNEPPEVYQLVWPGAQQGLFPWEEGCDQYVINMQPKLWT